MKSRATVVVISLLAGVMVLTWGAHRAFGANNAPLSAAWNIAPSGRAASSGELLFRVTPGNGDDALEIPVSVMSGATDLAVARKIRGVLGTRLRADQFNVTMGEGANVLVTDQRGLPNFSLELVDSDIENLRVVVRSAQPTASPTVPKQSAPATAPMPATPAAPGDAAPPANATPPGDQSQPAPTPPGDQSQPAAPPPANAPPLPNPSPPPGATDSAGAPASAPPPASSPPQ